MVGPFGCIFGIIIAGFAILLMISLQLLIGVKRFFNSFSFKKNKGNKTAYNNTQQSSTHKSSSHQKIFDDNEGEYVDFEEIK